MTLDAVALEQRNPADRPVLPPYRAPSRPLMHLPFWGLFLYWAFLPARFTPWVEMGGVPIASWDLLAVAVAGFYALLWLTTPRLPGRQTWHARLPQWTAGVILYALLSCLWNGLEGTEWRAMCVNALLSLAALGLAYFLVSTIGAGGVRSLLFALTVAIAIVGLAYSAESFLGLGVRSELGEFYSMYGFGIQRVHGPLFASSRGQIILIPALAFAFQSFLNDRRKSFLKILLILSLTVALLGLGSRAGLMMLIALAAVTFVILRRRVFSLLLLLAILGAGWSLVFSEASSDRLRSLEDSGRQQTYLTAWETVRHREPLVNSTGSGYGSMWHWYLEDVLQGDQIARGDYLRLREYGKVLYEAHSLVLVLLVELGIAGALFLLRFWAIVSSLALRAVRNRTDAVFACGVAVSAVFMFGEALIFKDVKLTAIWLIFVLGALALNPPRPKEGAAGVSETLPF